MRGAWIEIMANSSTSMRKRCRSPCGERGLKLVLWLARLLRMRRSPCGERGLKYSLPAGVVHRDLSLPVRGAWIEMTNVS